jgi:hypothetical protein
MFDFKSFVATYGVETAPTGHKHTRENWIQIPCPFCTGNPGWHLGYNLIGGFFNCWRCGWHPNLEVVQYLSGTGWTKAKAILSEFETGSTPLPSTKRRIASPLSLPTGTGPLMPKHMRYLHKRGFDPDSVAQIWELQATGPIGKYKHRIIAPIYLNNYLISYQGRDWTEKSGLRYKACETDKEIVAHQEVLYGIDLAVHHKAILVEGITDAWRFGPGAVACFGIETKKSQILLLMERFTEVYIMFDDDPQATDRAEEIAADLSMAGLYTEICLIEGDPGDLSQDVADQYKNDLLGDIYN